MAEKIGVYVCHCGTNIAHTVDVEDVARYASGLPNVVISREYKYMCSDPGQDLIKADIEELGLTRVVVASCSPLMHEPTFRSAVAGGKMNPYLMQMANIREQCSWVTNDRVRATEKAKALVSAAVHRVVYQQPLEPKEFPVNQQVLVVGAGIAGIEAALKIADAGKKVYLVERETTIGGHMAQFDKTFPTLDCAACILTPKMVTVGRHPNIELMPSSEVKSVEGFVGNFKVKVDQKARFVEMEDCTGCGECTKVCPVQVPSEFELGMSKRGAVYRAFPQAVPGSFVIDRRGVAPCRAACPAGVNVQGYVATIREGKFREAAEIARRTIPLPAACGRVCYHNCEKECERAKVDEPIAINALKRFAADQYLKGMKDATQKPEPLPVTHNEKVAVVGSGPAGLACAFDLMKRGYAVTVFEKDPLPGGMLRYGIPSYRLPNEILDLEIDHLKHLGMEIRLNTRVGGDKLPVSRLFEMGYTAVFMALGATKAIEPQAEGATARGVMSALEFLARVNSGEKVSVGKRVAVIGGGNAAMDTARCAVRLGAEEVSIIYRRSREEMPAHIEEIEAAETEGVKFNLLVNPTRFIEADGKLARMELMRMDLGPPDASGRRRPIPQPGTEFTIDVDTVIAAIGQVPDFSDLDPKLRVTAIGALKIDPITMETPIKGLFAAGDCVTGPATVIEAFAGGNEAAESIHRYLRNMDMKADREPRWKAVKEVDKSRAVRTGRTRMPMLDKSGRVKGWNEVELGYSDVDAIREAKRCLDCAVCSECRECEKVCERHAINFDMFDREVDLEVGAIVLATGYKLFDATVMSQYGYGRLPNVLSSLEFERLTHASGPTSGEVLLQNGKRPSSVAIIHCIGSRDENHNRYCSRVCCMYALKFAHLVKEKTGAEVYDFYIDMRAFGKGYEEFYGRLMEEGVVFVRGKPAMITDNPETPEEEGKLMVVAEDTLLGFPRRIPVDMVVLCNALEPQRDAKAISNLFTLSCGGEGFFLEKHPKLAPVATATDGVFIAGACQAPKDIPDSVAQGAAAAAEALSLLDRGQVKIEPITSQVNEDLCAGCRICEKLCPYSAIEFKIDQNVSSVLEALCKGCGTCAAACPSGAMSQRHFTDQAILAEIEGVMA